MGEVRTSVPWIFRRIFGWFEDVSDPRKRNCAADAVINKNRLKTDEEVARELGLDADYCRKVNEKLNHQEKIKRDFEKALGR